MNNTIITYRGATINGTELNAPQQPDTRLVQYRGATIEMDVNAPHPQSMDHVSYRGAKADMMIEH